MRAMPVTAVVVPLARNDRSRWSRLTALRSLLHALGARRSQNMSRGIPADAAALDEVIRSRLADGYRVTFTIRPGGRAVGITSVLLDPHDPSVRVGGTLLDPGVCGTGANTEVTRLLAGISATGPAQGQENQNPEPDEG
jgi:RimJ/RimL family protein N-acetyltransferase